MSIKAQFKRLECMLAMFACKVFLCFLVKVQDLYMNKLNPS